MEKKIKTSKKAYELRRKAGEFFEKNPFFFVFYPKDCDLSRKFVQYIEQFKDDCLCGTINVNNEYVINYDIHIIPTYIADRFCNAYHYRVVFLTSNNILKGVSVGTFKFNSVSKYKIKADELHTQLDFFNT